MFKAMTLHHTGRDHDGYITIIRDLKIRRQQLRHKSNSFN